MKHNRPEAADEIARLRAENARLREALWIYREFVIRNATQWQTGANHHHPIYPMIAELIGEMGGITSGKLYTFIQPENRQALQEGSRHE